MYVFVVIICFSVSIKMDKQMENVYKQTRCSFIIKIHVNETSQFSIKNLNIDEKKNEFYIDLHAEWNRFPWTKWIAMIIT